MTRYADFSHDRRRLTKLGVRAGQSDGGLELVVDESMSCVASTFRSADGDGNHLAIDLAPGEKALEIYRD